MPIEQSEIHLLKHPAVMGDEIFLLLPPEQSEIHLLKHPAVMGGEILLLLLYTQ
ncbi:hypothetical protein ACP6PL_00360 [Dapis sp. BLCC M126]